MLSHLLQLADRIAILIDVNRDVLLQANNIVEKKNDQSGSRFVPEQLEALLALRDKEYFWLDSVYMKDLNYLGRRIDFQEISLTEDDFLGLTNVFRRIIDFRSPFTATHSAGVAATAEVLAMKLGFSGDDQKLITLAGLLHDLGKLAVPTEILEKPGVLTEEEFDLVKRHTYYTFHLLEPLKIMDIIRTWGALHHERLDGKGYPFHINEEDLSLGSRVVAVADTFTALTENRPYRAGMDGAQAFEIITEMVGRGNLDKKVVSVLEKNLGLIDNDRKMAQKSAVDEYQRFKELAILLTK
jgi:HD-GYP domain-containing protein (c-di-GMP phosphodiesterase class II)